MDVDPPSMPIKPETVWPGRNSAGINFFLRNSCAKEFELRIVRDQALATGERLFFGAAIIDVIEKLLDPLVAAHFRIFVFAELYRAESGEVLCVFRDFNQVLRLRSLRDFNLPLLPHARDVGLPCLAHPLDEPVWATEEQNVRTQRMSARQYTQVLQDDGFKE